MIWADCLFVLCAAEIISLFGQMHEKVHAQVAYQLLGLLVDPRLLRQLLHDQLLHRGSGEGDVRLHTEEYSRVLVFAKSVRVRAHLSVFVILSGRRRLASDIVRVSCCIN